MQVRPEVITGLSGCQVFTAWYWMLMHVVPYGRFEVIKRVLINSLLVIVMSDCCYMSSQTYISTMKVSKNFFQNMFDYVDLDVII